ncbi:iron(III) transport system permease protein [Fontibacillus panacisegetis]|uniref:Iron(III) transport system permease protein n=1 Tax=Fontibacillus panacisegetis TaxID=670482 RepID=A0A1G7J5J5_9BACL|nr:iron ABC transporter permease [Fontibacillus panacisegetis]SDF20173.1 iron(III) transport system permease protein [Fontibacillus panacisegetis]
MMKEKKGTGESMKRLFKDPSSLILVLTSFIFLILFVIYPLIVVVFTSGFDNWGTFFSKPRYGKALLNTIVSSSLSALTATVVGFIYAYAINYSNIKGKKFFRFIAFIPLLAPSVMSGLAFLLLFGRGGMISQWLNSNFNIELDLYGLPGLWIVQTISYFPLAYMTITGVLRSISPNLEIAAQNLGARGFKLFRTITLKLALPGVINAFLLVAINCFADFGNPKLIGGNYSLLAVEIYGEIINNEPGLASVMGIILVIPALLVFWLQNKVLSKGSYSTITGKPVSGLKRITTSKKTDTMLFIFNSLISLFIISMFAITILYAFTKNFGRDNTFTLDHIMKVVFSSSSPAVLNSLVLSLISAVLAVAFALVLAYVIIRKPFPGKKALDFTAVLPIALPGTFVGLALIVAFSKGPIVLQGSAALIVIAMLLKQMPVGYRGLTAAFKQVDKSIEEAATNLGANSQKTLSTIVFPMLQKTVVANFVYAFMKNMNTLSTIIFLITPKWVVAAVSIFNYAETGTYYWAAAVAVGLMGATLGTLGIIKLIFRDKVKIFDF